MTKRRRPKGTPPRFVLVYEWEMDLPAWQEMSVYGRCAVLELRRKYNGHNNGGIVLSVRELARLINCHKDTANKALREVQEKGWAVPVQKGCFSQKTNKTATIWRITNQAVGLGVEIDETKEYARWRPEKQNAVPTDRTTRAVSSHRVSENGPTK